MAAEANLQDRVRYGEETRRGDYESVRDDILSFRRISRDLGWDGNPEHLHSSNYDLAESRGSSAEERQFSVDEKSNSVYNNSVSWGLNIEVLSKADVAAFYRAVGEIKSKQYPKNLRTPNGEYIISHGHVIMFTDGDFENPSLPRIIDINEYFYADTIETAKEMIIREERETGRHNKSDQILENLFGEGFAVEYRRPADDGHAWKERHGKGSNGGRTYQENLNTDTEASEESGASSVDRQYSLYNDTAILKESTVDKYLADYAAKSTPKD